MEALAHSIVYVVAEVGTEREAEVPVLILQARSQAHGDRSCRALVVVTVIIGDLTVAVTIDNSALNGLAILVISLLEHPEGVHRMTHLLIFEVFIGTDLDACVGDRSTIAGNTGKVKNLVAVVSEVVVQGPVPVLRTDHLPTDGRLNTHVAQRTDVLPCLVTECRESLCRSIVEQVFGLTIVPVNATSEALVKHTPVNTYIIGSGGLPLQLRSVVVRTIERTITISGI